MYFNNRMLSALAISFALAAPAGMSGCAPGQVYDLTIGQPRVWDRQEETHYQEWESDTHRPHRNYKKRPADEQKEYWGWRHGHPDDANQGHRSD